MIFFDESRRDLRVTARLEDNTVIIETSTGYRLTALVCQCGNKKVRACPGWHESRAVDVCRKLLRSRDRSQPHEVGATREHTAGATIYKDGEIKEAYQAVTYWPVAWKRSRAVRGDGRESPTDYGFDPHKLIEGDL